MTENMKPAKICSMSLSSKRMGKHAQNEEGNWNNKTEKQKT